MVGIEPTTCSLRVNCSAIEPHQHKFSLPIIAHAAAGVNSSAVRIQYTFRIIREKWSFLCRRNGGKHSTSSLSRPKQEKGERGGTRKNKAKCWNLPAFLTAIRFPFVISGLHNVWAERVYNKLSTLSTGFSTSGNIKNSEKAISFRQRKEMELW